MKKDYFKGEYYKFINKDGFSFALIDGNMANGKVLQIVTDDNSYVIENKESVIIKDKEISFNIEQDSLSLKGTLAMSNMHPLKKDVMGYLRKLPIECKHNIYSMYHNINGDISINGKNVSFNNAVGYIEGDEGRNFPSEYIWYNSIANDYGVTLAIARIPLTKHISFLGSFLIVKNKDIELVVSTLNGLKIKERSKNKIILAKGSYRFILDIPSYEGKPLLAPQQGVMKTTIHEAVGVSTSFKLFKKDTLLLERNNVLGSLERVKL